MKIQSLRYFVTLVQAGSITKAAQQLYVAQPSLTKSLKLLEEELGYPLVERSASGVHLTKKGAGSMPRRSRCWTSTTGGRRWAGTTSPS